MPSTFTLPDYPITVNADDNQRKRVTPTSTARVFADDKEIKEPIVVAHAVVIHGTGVVSVEPVDDKATVKAPNRDEVVPVTNLPTLQASGESA